MARIGRLAKSAKPALATAPRSAKDRALTVAAATLRARTNDNIAGNAEDLARAKAEGKPSAFDDRLMLDTGRIEGIARSLEEIAALADPVGLRADEDVQE